MAGEGKKSKINESMKKVLLYTVVASTMLSGCKLYSTYERTDRWDKDVETLYRDGVNSTDPSVAAADEEGFGALPWQEVYTQPQLQSLIERVLVNNGDVKAAALNIKKAEAGLKIAKLAYIPSMALAPTGTIASFDLGKASQTYTIPLAASWDFGSMGSLRNTKQQAFVALEQTKVAEQAVKAGYVSGIANMYYSLCMLDEQLKTSRESLVLLKKTVETLEAMKEAGMVNDVTVAQAKANYIELQASIPMLEKSISEVENMISVYVGDTPHAIERGSFDDVCFPEQLSAGVPMRLLAARPDVRLAELSLASQFYNVNIARSAFYPGLNITGTAGFTNSAGGMVINPAKFIASVVGSITQPIFANGRLMANLKINKLDLEIADLNFRKVLLTAGQEVSDALCAYQAAIKTEALRAQEVETLTKTLANTEDLFKYSASTTYLDILTAQMSLISAQLSLINDK